jgi:predicted membrane protein
MIKVLAFLSAVAFGFVCAAYVVSAHAFVVCKIWDWHITPWLGVHSPSFWQAIAVALLVGLSRDGKTDKSHGKDVDWAKVAIIVIGPWISLGLAWLIR